MANYLTVGHMEEGILVELSPKRRVRVLEAATGRALARDDPKAAPWIHETIAHYQLATTVLGGK